MIFQLTESRATYLDTANILQFITCNSGWPIPERSKGTRGWMDTAAGDVKGTWLVGREKDYEIFSDLLSCIS